MNIERDILPLKDTMYRLALRITLSTQEAEDVVQDVVIKLWNSRDSLGGVDNLEAYAMRMVRNTAINRQQLKVNQTVELTPANDQPQPEDSGEDERLQSIRDMMERLPEKLRTAMQLRDFEGYSYKEVAQIMAITEDQVKVCIYRARQFIKTQLQ